MGQAALSNEKQPAPFFVSIQKPLPKAAAPPQSSQGTGAYTCCVRGCWLEFLLLG